MKRANPMTTAKKNGPARTRRARATSSTAPARPTLCLGRVIERAGEAWRVEVDGRICDATADASVDARLLEECMRDGARVLVEAGERAVIAGALVTRRAVTIASDNTVTVKARAVTIEGRDEVTLKSAGAFIRMRDAEVETYGARVLHTARELFKVLGRMVKIN